MISSSAPLISFFSFLPPVIIPIVFFLVLFVAVPDEVDLAMFKILVHGAATLTMEIYDDHWQRVHDSVAIINGMIDAMGAMVQAPMVQL